MDKNEIKNYKLRVDYSNNRAKQIIDEIQIKQDELRILCEELASVKVKASLVREEEKTNDIII